MNTQYYIISLIGMFGIMIGLVAWFRLRGDAFNLRESWGKAVEQSVCGIMYACMVVVASFQVDWWYLAIPLLYVAGVSPGWSMIGEWIRGEQQAPETYEGWQKTIAKVFSPILHNTTLALIIRGLIYGLPLMLLGYTINDMYVTGLGGALFFCFPLTRFALKDWEASELAEPVFVTIFYTIIVAGL